MATVTISPNMNLTVPVTGQEPGPAWANDINNCMGLIDAHNHSPGFGVQINPNGININADMPFNNNNAITLKTVRFTPQGAPIVASSPNLGCLYEAGVDLYYNDGAGNQIRLTAGGSVAGASGTITGLPSGTASAAYNSGAQTFVFQSATLTPANMDVASIIIRDLTASSHGITLSAPGGLGVDYTLTLPSALAANSGAFLTSSNAGAISYTNVDNVTLQITGGVVAVGARNLTGPSGSLGQVAVSASSGSFVTNTTSYSPVTNLSVTLPTNGGLVNLCLVPTSGDQLSHVGYSGTGSAYLAIKNGSGTVIYSVQFPTGTGIPPGSFQFYDYANMGTPGTYTYSVHVKADTTSNIIVSLCDLMAYEIR